MAIWHNPFGGGPHVVCPACNGRAVVLDWQLTCTACAHRRNLGEQGDGHRSLPTRCPACNAQSRPRRFVYRPRCPACGTVVTHREMLGPEHEPLRLWAEVSTRNGVLWAMNPEHVKAMRTSIAGDRQRTYNPVRRTHRLSHNDWRARLPGWMKRARNRRTVLRALDKLEARFAQDR